MPAIVVNEKVVSMGRVLKPVDVKKCLESWDTSLSYRRGQLSNMKNRFVIFFLTALLILFIPVTVYADMGPKPCIYVTFENVGDKTIYASLYATEGGPSPVSFGDWKEVPEDIKDIFLNYSAKESARFVEDIWIINKENPVLDCGYIPPRKYKLVAYIPDENKMVESDIYTRQKFEEKYIADFSSIQSDGKVTLESEPYDWLSSGLSIAIRVVLTAFIEIAIAFLFKIKGKKSILVLVITNVVTQMFLNVSIALVEYRYGAGFQSLFDFFIIEIMIFFIEAFVYAKALKKTNKPPVAPATAVVYAFVANFITLLVGLFT